MLEVPAEVNSNSVSVLPEGFLFSNPVHSNFICPRGLIGPHTWTVTYPHNAREVHLALRLQLPAKTVFYDLSGEGVRRVASQRAASQNWRQQFQPILLPVVWFEPALAALFKNTFQTGIGCWLVHVEMQQSFRKWQLFPLQMSPRVCGQRYNGLTHVKKRKDILIGFPISSRCEGWTGLTRAKLPRRFEPRWAGYLGG